MLYREIMSVCCEIYTDHVTTLGGGGGAGTRKFLVLKMGGKETTNL